MTDVHRRWLTLVAAVLWLTTAGTASARADERNQTDVIDPQAPSAARVAGLIASEPVLVVAKLEPYASAAVATVSAYARDAGYLITTDGETAHLILRVVMSNQESPLITASLRLEDRRDFQVLAQTSGLSFLSDGKSVDSASMKALVHQLVRVDGVESALQRRASRQRSLDETKRKQEAQLAVQREQQALDAQRTKDEETQRERTREVDRERSRIAEQDADNDAWRVANATSCRFAKTVSDCDGVLAYLHARPRGTHSAEATALRGALHNKPFGRCVDAPSPLEVVVHLAAGQDLARLEGCTLPTGIVMTRVSNTDDGWLVGSAGPNLAYALKPKRARADGSIFQAEHVKYVGLRAFHRVLGGTAQVPSFVEL